MMTLGLAAYAVGAGLTADWCYRRGFERDDLWLIFGWPIIPALAAVGWGLILADMLTQWEPRR